MTGCKFEKGKYYLSVNDRIDDGDRIVKFMGSRKGEKYGGSGEVIDSDANWFSFGDINNLIPSNAKIELDDDGNEYLPLSIYIVNSKNIMPVSPLEQFEQLSSDSQPRISSSTLKLLAMGSPSSEQMHEAFTATGFYEIAMDHYMKELTAIAS